MELPRYAEVDLSTGEIKDYPISRDCFECYLGGKALAARILYDVLPPGVAPLSPENVLIINTGPLTGTGAPSSGRFNVTTKNVLTGGIASSNCGGALGARLRRAGYEGLIIRGRAASPSFIEVVDGQIRIRDASDMWGLNTEETRLRFGREYGTLVIGPAGENQVRYACAVSGERVIGRCGVGAVMGSKNLKAVVAAGKKKIPLAEPEAFREFSRRWVKLLQAHTSTGEILPRYGTANFVRKMNDAGILPTRNYQRGKFEEADRISGEYLAEKHLIRNSGCPGCPIRCERRVMLGDKEVKGPEYETLGMLGSNLENSDLEMIKAWNHQADLLGLDTISLGSVLGFAMELQERGIKDFGLRFGETAGIAEVINKITYREGEYSDLADGVKALADKYGGREFAIHSKGLELAAYDPRKAVGMGLGYATANRGGCHLNGGYLVFLEALGPLFIDALTDKGKPALAVLFQNGMEAISAAGSCLFTSFTLVPDLIYKMNPGGAALKLLGKSMIGSRFLLERTGGLLPYLLPFNSLYLFPHAQAVRLATGIKMTTGKFLQLGERSFNMERVFNIREGINGTEDSLPRRLTDEAMDPARSDSKVDLSAMLPLYYKIRGWDKAGQPTTNKLRQLQIVV